MSFSLARLRPGSWLPLLALLFAAGRSVAGPASSPGDELHVFHHENVLGTALELRIGAASAADARLAEEAVLAEIDRLAVIFSTYDETSEFSRWQRTHGEPVKLSAELREVMQMADTWRQRTGGAFNPGAAVFTSLWREAALRDEEPAAADLGAAAALIARPAWSLDPVAGTATRLATYPLTLDAIAKGYIVERAGQAARAAVPSVDRLVVNIGGDLRVWGREPFPIAIADPAHAVDNAPPIETIALRDAALATSGGYRRGFLIQGRSYSHLFDARTGRPVEHVASSSVLARDAAEADALATAFSILDPEESAQLAAATPGVGFLLVSGAGAPMRSPRWPGTAGTAMAMMAAPPADSAAAAWGRTHELVVTFEINSPATSRRYARPYVAIWVEDAEGRAVRTLLVWYDRPRWLPDLRRWNRADSLRARSDPTDVLATISDATRSPGAYFLGWDGLDDRKVSVPAGTYKLMIEAVREHGTYQIMQQEITVGGDEFTVKIPGNEEIKSATLEYRRRDQAR